MKRDAFEAMLADALGGKRNALAPDPERTSVAAHVETARLCGELIQTGRHPVLPADPQDVPPCF